MKAGLDSGSYTHVHAMEARLYASMNYNLSPKNYKLCQTSGLTTRRRLFKHNISYAAWFLSFSFSISGFFAPGFLTHAARPSKPLKLRVDRLYNIHSRKAS